MEVKMDSDLLADICLNMLPGIGPKKYDILIKNFGSSSAVFKASSKELKKCTGIGEVISEEILNWHNHYSPEEEAERARIAGIKIINRNHKDYPPAFNNLHDSPILIYVRGNSELLKNYEYNLGVVGTRRPSLYGIDSCKNICQDAAFAGMNIVSGLACGIDTAAHESAVLANKPTIAILGGGLGKIYPAENVKLARNICDHGAIVSEYPILFPPDRRTFPVRNRLIAALSRAVLVVEAGLNSGSLITADQALECGSSVFAIPGRIDNPQSRGCHRLLKQGATLTENFKDIFEELNLELKPCKKAKLKDDNELAINHKSDLQLSKNEQRIMGILKTGEVHIDKISEISELPVGKLLALLLSLETRRLIRLLPGRKYELIN